MKIPITYEPSKITNTFIIRDDNGRFVARLYTEEVAKTFVELMNNYPESLRLSQELQASNDPRRGMKG